MQQSAEQININQSGIEFNNLLTNTSKEELKQQEQKKQNQKNFNTLAKELNKTLKLSEADTDSKTKQKYVYQIIKYQDSPRFGNYIKKDLKINFNESALQKKSSSKLQEILNRIRINLDNRNLDNFYNAMLVNATLSFETLMENFYTIEGFSDSLMTNPHFLDSVERYKIENVGKMPSIPPSLQIIFIMSQTAMICHQLAIKTRNEESSSTLVMDAPELSEKDQNLLN